MKNVLCKRMIIVIGYLFIQLSAINAHAISFTGEGYVSWLSVESGGLYIQVSNSSGALLTSTGENCTFSHIYALDYTGGASGSSDAIYAKLLAAYVANTPVNVGLSGCSAAPLSAGYPIIQSVQAGSFKSP